MKGNRPTEAEEYEHLRQRILLEGNRHRKGAWKKAARHAEERALATEWVGQPLRPKTQAAARALSRWNDNHATVV